MKDPIVFVEDLWFDYTVRNAISRSIKQNIIEGMRGHNSDVHVTAVSGVTFNLYSGEVLGIVGNNGAGKSTLLKLLAGILPPSSGVVNVRGQIAPLVELGAGFNPEISGAENIILFGVLLGNSKRIMKENVLSIATWAGLSEVINLPIRTYSTGMLSRLGFAVATFRQSELLIIDEVLSVGDLQFQIKSMARMDELISKGEATILVSHDLSLVQAKASKVLWLEHGRQVMFGDTKKVIDAYTDS